MPHRILLKLRSSMNAKIVLAVILPVVLVTSFFSYHHYSDEREIIFQNAESQLLRIAENLKSPCEIFLKKRDQEGLREMLDKAALVGDFKLVTVFDARGTVIGCNEKQWTGRILHDMFPEAISDKDVAAIQKSFGGGYSSYYDAHESEFTLVLPLPYGDQQGAGVLFISLDVAATNEEVRNRAVENTVIGAAVSILIGVTVYFLVHSLFTRRVKSVSSAAVKLAAGDLNARAGAGGTDEISYLATSFNLLADEITNWRSNLEEMAASRLKDLTVLYEVVDTISQSLELDKVLPRVLDRVLENMHAGMGVVILIGGDGKTLTRLVSRGLSEEGLRRIAESGQGGVGDAILRRSAIRVPGEGREEYTAVPGLEQDNIQSALVVPISFHGNVHGVIAVYSGKRDAFSDQDEALLTTVGNQVGVAVENARLYEKTLELAQIDGLTGLANRRYLMERLQQEIERADRYNTSLSAIILDLDKFKTFNDTYGHLNGDELIKAFSGMLRQRIRAADVAGRYGGEEFCVVLPNTSMSGAKVIAESIRKSMEELQIPVGDGRFAGRTVSVGVAEFSAGDTMEKLLAAADAALYRAKQGGRNRVAASEH